MARRRGQDGDLAVRQWLLVLTELRNRAAGVAEASCDGADVDAVGDEVGGRVVTQRQRVAVAALPAGCAVRAEHKTNDKPKPASRVMSRRGFHEALESSKRLVRQWCPRQGYMQTVSRLTSGFPAECW